MIQFTYEDGFSIYANPEHILYTYGEQERSGDSETEIVFLGGKSIWVRGTPEEVENRITRERERKPS